MLTVRFPNGVAVTYNAANHLEYRNTCLVLRAKEGGQWLASIANSSGAIVEAVAPCKVTQTINDTDAAIAHLQSVAYRREGLPYYGAGAKLGDLKRALGRFDARRRAWKGGAK